MEKKENVIKYLLNLIERDRLKKDFPNLYSEMSSKLMTLEKTLSEDIKREIYISPEVIDDFKDAIAAIPSKVGKNENECKEWVKKAYYGVDYSLSQWLTDYEISENNKPKNIMDNTKKVSIIENASYEQLNASKAKRIKIFLVVVLTIAAIAVVLAIIGVFKYYIENNLFAVICESIGDILGSLDFFFGLFFGLREYFDDVNKRTVIRSAANKDIANNTTDNSLNTYKNITINTKVKGKHNQVAVNGSIYNNSHNTELTADDLIAKIFSDSFKDN